MSNIRNDVNDVTEMQSQAEAEETVQIGEQQETVVESSKGQKPNVILAKSQKDMALQKGTTNIGMASFEIPDVEQQLGGFYVEDPGTLVGQFGQYKFIQEKGASVPNINIS